MIKIIILGGGFGGVRCALDLEKKLRDQAEISLIDKNNYHLFLPSLYEIASAYGVKKDSFALRLRKTVCVPYGDIFEGKKINFIEAEVCGVDLENQTISTKGDRVLHYDYLVIGLGSQTADFGIPGVRDYAYQFKSIDDALAVNGKLESLMTEVSSGQKTTPIRILIGGAGFNGIELASELACCIKRMTNHQRLTTNYKRPMITLIEATSKILPMVSDEERNIILKRLTKLGVIVMAHSQIEEVGSGLVRFKDGHKLEGDMVIWTAGIKANEFLKSISDLELTDSGKVIVEESLSVKGRKNVFGVGDNIEVIDPKTQKPVPAMAYTAVAQGKVVAQNIQLSIKDKKLKVYKPFYGVWIAPVGGKYALAHLWGRNISGLTGWIIRELVDLRYLTSILSPWKALSLFWQEVTLFTKND